MRLPAGIHDNILDASDKARRKNSSSLFHFADRLYCGDESAVLRRWVYLTCSCARVRRIYWWFFDGLAVYVVVVELICTRGLTFVVKCEPSATEMCFCLKGVMQYLFQM